MNILVFVIGCILFCLALGLVVFWSLFEDAEDFFYRSFFGVICMTTLCFFVKLYGNSIFTPNVVKWIVVASGILTIVAVIIYIYGYIEESVNDFDGRLLLFLVPAILSLGIVVTTLFPKQLENVFKDDFTLTTFLVGIISYGIVTLVFPLYNQRIKKMRAEINILKNSKQYNYLDSRNFYKMNLTKSDIINVEKVATDIYIMAQDSRFSVSKTLNILEKQNIPSDLLHKMMDRLYGEGLIERCQVITLSEYLQELLPEVFSSHKVYRSSSMDMRYYEDLYEKLRYSLRNDNNQFIGEINKKIDTLHLFIKSNLPNDTREIVDKESFGVQNQIRELFHALETPIATSEMAISNLMVSFETLTPSQKERFGKIQNNLKLIKSILFAYRELTFMNVYSSENTFFSLPAIIESMKDLISNVDKNVELKQSGMPDSIPKYSTNLIVVLLLPLIHNALEASPDKKSVLVNYDESEFNHTIKIENFCIQTPRQVNLNTEGYSSKGNNHVGTGISIVRRISKSVGVEFSLKVDNNRVLAELVFPKQ